MDAAAKLRAEAVKTGFFNPTKVDRGVLPPNARGFLCIIHKCAE